MRYCGIDLHSDSSVVVVTDEADKVLVSKRCPNDLQKILALLARIGTNSPASSSSPPTTGTGWSTA